MILLFLSLSVERNFYLIRKSDIRCSELSNVTKIFNLTHPNN